MAELAHDVYFASIPELNKRLLDKEFNAEDLTKAFAARLERLGPRFNALALSLTPQAIRQAKDTDKEIKRGRLRGPLQGIPYAVKDLLAYAGQPTTWGAKPYAAQVFDYNATVIEKLSAVGAVITGKLAMVELAGGGGYRYPSASLQGPGLNPWDPSRWSGGSSSGSAAAVAAGLAPFALGSETSGSILTPAAFCGVTGLRPTYGLVSRYGAMALSWTLDKVGPFAHSAEDCALVLHEIAGKDGKDPGSAGKSFYYTPQYARKMQDIRVGYAPVDFAEWADPDARPAFAAALAVLKDLGVQMIETKLPELPYGPTISTIIAAEGASIFEELITSGRVNEMADKKQISGLKAALEIPAKDYLKAMRIRRIIQEQIGRLFGTVDVLLAPARLGPASKIEQALDRGARTGPPPKDPGMTALIPAGNLAGLPAISVPCGFAGNLPVAFQLVGVPFSENTLVAVAKEFQARTDWHKRHPAGV